MENDRRLPPYLIGEEECTPSMHALVTGSFDPITVGHMDIVRRSAEKFRKVTVCVFVNPDKEYLLSLEEKQELLKVACRPLPNVCTDCDTGMVFAYCCEKGIDVIVRGTRNAADDAAEHAAARFNYEHCGVRTLLLQSDPTLRQVSSSFLKDRLIRGESVDKLLPQGTEELFFNMLLQQL